MANMSPIVMHPKPRRCAMCVPHWGWFLLTAVVVAASGMALRIGIPVCKRYMAIRQIERAGGSVGMKPGGPDWLRAWVGDEWMKPFDDVFDIDLHGTEFADDDLECLRCLPRVEQLWLDGTSITDVGLRHLERSRELQILNLSGTDISDGGLRHLKGLPILRRLDVRYTEVTDHGLEHLKGMKSLATIDVGNTHVTLKGWRAFEQERGNGTARHSKEWCCFCIRRP